MKYLAYILILFSASALADTYIEKSGNKCPPGYSDTSGAYCRSSSDSINIGTLNLRHHSNY